MVAKQRNNENCAFLSQRGQLKVATRFIRHGQIFDAIENKVLMFIVDRTVSWNNVSVPILPEHWANGVRSGRGDDLDCLPVGLSGQQIDRAVGVLEQQGAILRRLYGNRVFYELNYDFSAPGLRNMWSLRESDYDHKAMDE